VPVGRPVTDPYIPMVAYTEEQTEELAYGALLFICQEGPDADLFDAGKEQITRIYGDGKAEAMASSPNSVDGARTTCQHFDETHRMILPRLKDTRQTMRNNLPKRVIADPWELETTTTYAEGEGSCAQDTHEYAESIAKGKIKDSTLFFFHREAPARDDEDLDDPVQIRAAIRTASGPALALWTDFEGQVDSIASLYAQPDTDKAYWERVWLNRRVARPAGVRPGPVEDPGPARDRDRRRRPDRGRLRRRPVARRVRVHRHAHRDRLPVAAGLLGAAGGRQARRVGSHRRAGRRRARRDHGTVQGRARVRGPAAVRGERREVVRRLRLRPVVEWYTNRPRQIGQAMRAYATAQTSNALTHSGDETFARHIGNARKVNVNQFDDDGTPLWTIYKPKPDSPLYIDLGMAGCLSWQARLDALAKGGWQKKNRKVIVMR
jgi:hypothetical protein